MKTHPFKPLVSSSTKKLLIGTLPPEDVTFYFSNSSNTRLWDILNALNNRTPIIGQGGNKLSDIEKTKLLKNLNLGISDIIYGYERDDYESTKDRDIQPKEYNDLLKLAHENGIDELLFVYQSALKWFIHSLKNEPPVRLKKIREKYNVGLQDNINYKGKSIKCVLLPSPLNRGRKGETLEYKLSYYKQYIFGD
jgi:G:T/U-mismatch repair DNA glycosylase